MVFGAGRSHGSGWHLWGSALLEHVQPRGAGAVRAVTILRSRDATEDLVQAGGGEFLQGWGLRSGSHGDGQAGEGEARAGAWTRCWLERVMEVKEKAVAKRIGKGLRVLWGAASPFVLESGGRRRCRRGGRSQLFVVGTRAVTCNKPISCGNVGSVAVTPYLGLETLRLGQHIQPGLLNLGPMIIAILLLRKL